MLKGTVTDSGGLSMTGEIILGVVEQAFDFTPSETGDLVDSDGDGIADSVELQGDEDGDGVPNYLDNNTAMNIQLIRDPDASNEITGLNEPDIDKVAHSLYAQALITIRLGELALQQIDNVFEQLRYTLGISEFEVASSVAAAANEGVDSFLDDPYEYAEGLVDFVFLDVPVGDTTDVVLPLLSPLTTTAFSRVFVKGTWQDFVLNGTNSLSSALGSGGVCPEPGSALYQPNLTEGDRCVQLRIEDGGANDADETADGVIKQLSGIAELDINSSLPNEQTSSVSVGPNTVNANGDSEAQLTVTVVNAANVGLLGLDLELIGC